MGELWILGLAYLLGAIPSGLLLVRLMKGEDVRRIGSGNIGATNVLRAAGWKAGLLVFAADAGKGWLAVWIAERAPEGSPSWPASALLAAVAGNTLNVFLKFRGGKGFATAAGSMAALAPLPAAALAAVFFATAALTRHVSAGSIATAISAPLAVWIIEHPGPRPILLVAAAAGLIVFRHRENIRRLREGCEPVFRLRK